MKEVRAQVPAGTARSYREEKDRKKTNQGVEEQENEGSRYRQGQGWRSRKEEEVKERFLFRFLRQKTEVKAPFPIRIRRLVSVLAKTLFSSIWNISPVLAECRALTFLLRFQF